MTTQNKKLAILIDADNAPADCIDAMLEEIAKYGTATVKRIYGDWSHGLSKWKAALLPHAIIPVQQFAYTKGKNATDMALVIDAMDLLYSGNFDGFCLVSSDSDFTRLASRIRESGLTVYGFGEKKTPESFRKACDKFVYIEIFRPQKNHKPQNNPTPKSKDPNLAEHNAQPNFDLTELIKRAVKETADDLGWANLGPIGSYISKVSPDFDARLYGFGKLSDLIKSLDLFEHRTDNNQLQIRRKKATNAKQPEPLSGSLNAETPNEAVLNDSPPKRTRQSKNAAAQLAGSLNSDTANAPSQNNGESHQSSDDAVQLPATQPKKRGRKPKNVAAQLSGSLNTESPIANNSDSANALPNAEATQPEPLSGSANAVANKNKKRQPFTKLIPIVQQTISELADENGWAALGQVANTLNQKIHVLEYGFADGRDIIHAVYAEWIETKKIGRGERVRNQKIFQVKNG